MHAARAGASVVLMLSTMIACSGASPDPADADVPSTGTERVGSVYADLQVEYLAAGERVYRSMYDEVGRACRELGIGTQLPDEYVEKLGTSRLQVWSTHDRVAVRNEVYTYVAGPVEEGRHCDFEPATRGMHLYRDANETATWDLATGVESKAPPRPEYEWKRTAVATAPAATNPGTHERSASGVPCIEYGTSAGAGGRYCIWSGGGAYGFDTQGSAVSNAMGSEANMLVGLVIDQSPTDNGNGQRVTLSALVLDDDAPFSTMRPHAPTLGTRAGGRRR